MFGIPTAADIAALKERFRNHESVSPRDWMLLGDRIEEYERKLKSEKAQTDDSWLALYVLKGLMSALRKEGLKVYTESDVYGANSPELAGPELNGIGLPREGLFDALVALPFVLEGVDGDERTLRLDWPPSDQGDAQ